MKAVFKYPMVPRDEVTMLLPKGAEILTIQTQGETPCLWALVDPEQQDEPRRFRIAGTGHPINGGLAEGWEWRYIDTFQLAGGALIFHAFAGVQVVDADTKR